MVFPGLPWKTSHSLDLEEVLKDVAVELGLVLPDQRGFLEILEVHQAGDEAFIIRAPALHAVPH